MLFAVVVSHGRKAFDEVRRMSEQGELNTDGVGERREQRGSSAWRSIDLSTAEDRNSSLRGLD